MANVYDPKALIKLPGRSRLDLSYRNSFTTKMGLEVPILCRRTYPGDRFRIGLTYQMQLAPMQNPVYDGLEVNFEAFFVPNRIVDMRWKEFWTGYNEYDQMTPTDLTPMTLGSLTLTSDIADGDGYANYNEGVQRPIGIGSLLEFLGVQYSSYENGFPAYQSYSETGTTFELGINALPILAYNRIYDDWYRNERTQKARLFNYYNYFASTGRQILAEYNYNETTKEWENVREDGTLGSYIPLTMFKRNYKKDMFTTALPEPIIGGDVHIPVNSELNASAVSGAVASGSVIEGSAGSFGLNALALGTIEQLKLAYKEYEYRMKDTYNGNRYVESIESHFGVRVPDSTLQRSLYLGSARDYVNFGEVYQTSSGDGTGTNGALGDYAGRGAASGTHRLFDETFYEPGYVFVLMCVNPISRYYQGIKRDFIRFDRDDYFSPEYQNIGDDFIHTAELYNAPVDGDSPDTNEVFGFNSRWLDMKCSYNELHGEFANPSSTMFNWNFARNFEVGPVISSEFSEINPINKPFVDVSERNDNYFVDVAFDFQALRPVLAVESF